MIQEQPDSSQLIAHRSLEDQRQFMDMKPPPNPAVVAGNIRGFPRSSSLPVSVEKPNIVNENPFKHKHRQSFFEHQLCKDMNIKDLVNTRMTSKSRSRSFDRRLAMNMSSSHPRSISVPTKLGAPKSVSFGSVSVLNLNARSNRMSGRKVEGDSNMQNATWSSHPKESQEEHTRQQKKRGSSQIMRRLSESTENITKYVKVLVLGDSECDAKEDENILLAKMAEMEQQNIMKFVRKRKD